MRWANTPHGKALAHPGTTGTCPGCGATVIPKCGEILEWHWAHRFSDCDHWSEPESKWHLDWKRLFPSEWQEVPMGPHRADVLTPHGVIEFQKSPISRQDIRDRERFYGDMIWVVDASAFTFEPYRTRTGAPYFRWLWPRKSWQAATKPVLLDVGDANLYQIDRYFGQTYTYIGCTRIPLLNFMHYCKSTA